MDNSKACTKCGQIKLLTDFVKDKYKKSGYTSSCKECRCNFQKNKRQADPVYAEKLREESRAYYHANKSAMSENYKNWVKNNPEKRRLIDARFRENNRESQRIRAINYRLNNPDKRRQWGINNPLAQAAIYTKRSFQKRGGIRFYVSLAEIRRLYQQPCFYCGAKSEHIDHIVPLSRGGRHSIGNLTGACASCNLSKGSKFITEWKKGKNG